MPTRTRETVTAGSSYSHIPSGVQATEPGTVTARIRQDEIALCIGDSHQRGLMRPPSAHSTLVIGLWTAAFWACSDPADGSTTLRLGPASVGLVEVASGLN